MTCTVLSEGNVFLLTVSLETIAPSYNRACSVSQMLSAFQSDRAVKGMNRLRSLGHWDHVKESHSKRGCLCMLGSGLATG
jgi:hypothetical protein